MAKKKRRGCIVCKKWMENFRDSQWVCSIECARAKNNEAVEKKKDQLKKTEWTKEKAKMKINTHSKEHKSSLQNEINKLARMIDAKFGYGCIDMCGKPYGKQIDGAHFHSRGGNCSLRYHLHNIHSADSQCNQWDAEHKTRYRIGIEKRYGREYLQMIDELPLKHKELRLSNQEIYDKLAIVRKIIRTFDTYKFSTPITGRNIFNILIGIYP